MVLPIALSRRGYCAAHGSADVVLPIHNLSDAIVVLTESPLQHQPSTPAATAAAARATLLGALLLPPPHHHVAGAVECAARELRGNAHCRQRLLELCMAHRGRAGQGRAWVC